MIAEETRGAMMTSGMEELAGGLTMTGMRRQITGKIRLEGIRMIAGDFELNRMIAVGTIISTMFAGELKRIGMRRW